MHPTIPSFPRRRGRWLIPVLLAALALPAAFSKAGAQTSSSSSSSDDARVRRAVRMMEGVINDMLVDSQNVLVQSHEAAHGHLIPEFGVLFTTQASLLDRWWSRTNGNKWHWDWAWDDDDADDNDDDDSHDQARYDAHQKKEYEAFKGELVEALMSGGDNFSERLRDEQWIGISVALTDSRYFRKNKLRQLMVKARVSDLKAYAAGTLSETAMQGKIVTTES
jgi:hypothetical protein